MTGARTMRRVVRAIAVAVLLVVAGCGAGDGGAALVDPDTFAASVDEPGRVTVNVHVPFEGDIAGTDLSVPYNRIRSQAEKLPDPGTPLAVYCRSGSMSADAVPVLVALGYDDIVELDGGMLAWEESGRKLDKRGS